MANWRRKALTSFGVPTDGPAATLLPNFGNSEMWFVDAHYGKTKHRGDDPRFPCRGLDRALERVGSNDSVFIKGGVRFQGVLPQDVYGVKLIGCASGRPRHTTDSGAEMLGNGASIREEATALNLPLLRFREQGCEVHNLILIPQSGYAAVQLHTAETAQAMDGSHAIFRGVRFISPGSAVGYGLEDVGGAAHIGVYGCDFRLLEHAWKQTSVGIRNPQDHEWFDNRFSDCKNDIGMNADRCSFRRNRHRTKYNVTTHPITLNLALTGGNGSNEVIDVEFADATADVTIAKGYQSGTSDTWRTRVSDTAADRVTVPA